MNRFRTKLHPALFEVHDSPYWGKKYDFWGEKYNSPDWGEKYDSTKLDISDIQTKVTQEFNSLFDKIGTGKEYIIWDHWEKKVSFETGVGAWWRKWIIKREFVIWRDEFDNDGSVTSAIHNKQISEYQFVIDENWNCRAGQGRFGAHLSSPEALKSINNLVKEYDSYEQNNKQKNNDAITEKEKDEAVKGLNEKLDKLA